MENSTQYDFSDRGKVNEVFITNVPSVGLVSDVKFSLGARIRGDWTNVDFRKAIMEQCDSITVWKDSRLTEFDKFLIFNGANDKNSCIRLKDMLDILSSLKFITDTSQVLITVNKGKNISRDAKLFECFIQVEEAKRFFGRLKITLNQIREIEELKTPIFWFLLACNE